MMAADNFTRETKKTAPQKSVTPKSKPKKNETAENQPITQRWEVFINVRAVLNKVLLFVFIGLLFVPFLYNLVQQNTQQELSLSQVIGDVRASKVEKIEVSGPSLSISYKDGTKKKSRKEDGQELSAVFNREGLNLATADVTVRNLTFMDMGWQLLLNLLPIGAMVILFFFLYRQSRGAQDGIMGIGRSKAKLFVKGKQSTKFADVGGMTEAKNELEEIVDFLKHPKKYTRLGARTPKGVLLVGPSGTGKTLLARAVAGEAGVQFLSMAGSEFMEMLVGVGASRVRDLFQTAKKSAPSIIFIDEIDAIGRVRGMGSMGGHDEREQTLNQILVEMDGFTQNDNVIVMAATNRGDMLDPALIRPGRFDRRVQINLPDLEERKFILNIHARGKFFAKDVNWEKVAKRTVGFSGADLENMLNESAILIAREDRQEITMNDIEEASLKVKLGPSKKRLNDAYERKMTAYHEAGHAIVAHFSPHSDPVHRISILSRGMALGFTLTPPEKDKVQVTKSELIDEIAVLLGGRSAEELIFSELTAGASSDIERATRIARAMVMDYGMSELGPVNFSPQYDMSYTRSWGEPSKVSEAILEKVDLEVRKFINAGEKRAHQLITAHKKALDEVAMRLVENETIDGDEFVELVGAPKAKSV